MNALKDLFLNELSDMYEAEHRIMEALPGFIKAATSPPLQNALKDDLGETLDREDKIVRVFAAFDEKARARRCPAILGILEEGEEIISETRDSPAVNAAIVSAVRKVEHYERASYGSLRAWAGLLDNSEAAGLLEDILDEPTVADKILHDHAESRDEGGEGCPAWRRVLHSARFSLNEIL